MQLPTGIKEGTLGDGSTVYRVSIKVQVTHGGRTVRKTRKGWSPRTPGAPEAERWREIAAALEVRQALDAEARQACLEALGLAEAREQTQEETLRLYSLRWAKARSARWRSAKHARNVARHLASWVLPTLGGLTAAEITHRHGTAWWQMAMERRKPDESRWPGPYARKTLLVIWSVARGVVEDFRADHGLPEVWSRVQPPELKGRPRLERQRLTLAQAQAVIACVTTPTIRDLLGVVLDTGCRTKEVRLLKWSQVDLGRGAIALGTGETKTGLSREVVMFTAAREILERRWDERGQSGEITPFVFPSPVPDVEVYAHSTVRWHLARAATRAGLDQPLRPHTLRGVRATDLVARGFAQELVMHITGHLSSQSLAAYLRPTPEQVRAVVEG